MDLDQTPSQKALCKGRLWSIERQLFRLGARLSLKHREWTLGEGICQLGGLYNRRTISNRMT
jgi:hypothetical protein